MKKSIQRIWIAILAVILFVPGSVSARADESGSVGDYIAKANRSESVYDFAGLLDDSQENDIQEKISEAIASTKLDIVVLTVNQNFGYSQRNLADDFFDYGGFGYEDNIEFPSGVLLLVDMEDRQIYISTGGIAILYFNDEIIDIILDDITENASEGDYVKLCEEFVEDVVYYANMAASTEEYGKIISEWYTGNYQDYSELYEDLRSEFDRIGRLSFDYNPKKVITKDGAMDVYHMKYEGYHAETFFTIFRNPWIDFGIGAVIALAAVCIMVNHSRSKMTVNSKTYYNSNGSGLRIKKDNFIRRSTVSRKIQSSTGSGGKSGGGSYHSSHRGGSHGGGGRRF